MGYLIDKDGNVVDHDKRVQFKKKVLDQDRIPKVFRYSQQVQVAKDRQD